MSIELKRIHHVAYRCRDTKETVEFYQRVLKMDFVLAISEDKVPSTKEPDPYMHVFLDAGMGNILAFFELPNSDEMGRDENTPNWVQHLALEVDSVAALKAAKAERNLESSRKARRQAQFAVTLCGIPVLGHWMFIVSHL